MKDFGLDSTLRRAKVPERSDAYWDDLPRRITLRLPRVPISRKTEKARFLRLAWALPALAACLAALFVVVENWAGRARNALGGSVLENRKVITEMMAMFPNRLRAIVQDQRGLHVVLSDSADVPISTPVFVEVYDGKDRSSWVTFSGQDLRIAKERVEVLVDAQGQVMLVGDRLFWSAGKLLLAPDHLRIQARLLADNGKATEG